MSDLTTFLRARLDEDEARVYQEGTPPNGVIAWLTYHEPDGSMGYTTVAHGDTADGPWVADGRELAPPASVLVVHDPARVLREAKAKRAILEWHHPLQPQPGVGFTYPAAAKFCAYDGPGDGWQAEQEPDHFPDALWPCWTVRHLAAIYSDHPDYDPAWAPPAPA